MYTLLIRPFTLLLLLTINARAATQTHEVPGHLVQHHAMYIDGDGTLHMLLGQLKPRKAIRAKTSAGGHNISMPLRYLRWARTGAPTVTPVLPRFGRRVLPNVGYRGGWIVEGDNGQPFIYVHGRRCDDDGKDCRGFSWVVEGDPADSGARRSRTSDKDRILSADTSERIDKRIVRRSRRDSLHAVRKLDGAMDFQYFDPRHRKLAVGTITAGGGQIIDWADTAESGRFNGLVRTTDGRTVRVWHYYRSPYNRGVAVLADGQQGRTVVARSETDNIGWNVQVESGPNGALVIAWENRTQGTVVVRRFRSMGEVEANGIPPAGDWTDLTRRASAFGYTGGFFGAWSVLGFPIAGPNDEVDADAGMYRAKPNVGVQGGVSGRYGKWDLALAVLEQRSGPGAKRLHRVRRFIGRFGLSGYPFRGAETQLHYANTLINGTYTNTFSAPAPFRAHSNMLELRFAGRSGGYIGLRHRSLSLPMQARLIKPVDPDSDSEEVPDDDADEFIADEFIGSLGTDQISFMFGYSSIDYLKRHHQRYVGPYVDTYIGYGFLHARLEDPRNGKRYGTATSVLAGRAYPVRIDLGVIGYARNKRLRGAGWFLRGGARGDLEVMVLVLPRLAYHSALLETNLGGYLDLGFVY